MRSDRTVSRKATWTTLTLFAASCVFAGLSAAASRAAGQEQTSLGDAARKARAEKKNEPAPKTFTNENLPKTDAGISVVGPPPPEPAATPDEKPAEKPAAEGATPPAAKPTPASIAAQKLELQHQIDEANKEREQLEKEIDLAQRDYSLQEQQSLQNPNFKTDRDAQAHLAELNQGISDQKGVLEKVKAHIAELQQRLDDLNSNPGTGTN